MRVLVTRPEPDAARLAAKLSAAGHEVTVDSLLTIEPAAFDPPRGDYAALAATSANAPRAIGGASIIDALKSLPFFALGVHTANAARLAGFINIEIAGCDADAVGAMLARRLPAGACVLYLAGENRARELAALTAPAKVTIETLVVYRARAAEQLRETTVKKLSAREFDAVLHFSPRSAEIFVALARKAGLQSALSSIRHLCLSDAVAAVLSEAGGKMEIASRPEEAALLALLDA
jgi:uroporphyrinogen-III synthase